MGLFRDECPNCGAKVKKDVNYCSGCGKPLGKGERTCPKCGNNLAEQDKFCTFCGEAAEIASAAIDRRTWRRGPEDFAVRIEISDLKGFFKKDVVVEHGTKALLFDCGRLIDSVAAGKYSVDNFFKHFRLLNKNNPAHVVIVDAGDVEVDVAFDSLYTKENVLIAVRSSFRVQIDKPETFVFNVMKQRDRFMLNDLRRYVVDETRNVFQSLLKSQPIEELYGNLEIKKHLQEEMEHEMGRSLERAGLRIVSFPYFEFEHGRYKAIRDAFGKGYLDRLQNQIEVDDLKRALAQVLSKEQIRVAFEKDKVDLDTIRMELKNRIREIVAKDKVAEIKSEEDLINAVHDKDRASLLREQDIEDLRREYRYRIELQEVDHGLKIKKMKEDDEFERMKRESDEGMRRLKELKENKLVDARAYQELELERKRREAEIEKLRLGDRSMATPEALISMLDGSISREVLEAIKLNSQKGMSVEQILAAQAKEHPEVARIFQEKERALAGERERLYSEQKEFAEKLEKIVERGADRVERVATGLAGRPGAGSESGLISSSGGPVPFYGGAARVLICPNCKNECSPAAKFCPLCGTPLTHVKNR